MLARPPSLCRSAATCADDDCKSSWKVRSQVLRAYSRLPFRGPALVVSGEVVCRDAWQGGLDLALDVAEAEGGMEAFSLEDWLSVKIATEGTDKVKKQWQSLVATLDDVDHLPPNISDVYVQPLVEIEVYRGLDIAVEKDDDFSDLGSGLFFSEEDDNSDNDNL